MAIRLQNIAQYLCFALLLSASRISGQHHHYVDSLGANELYEYTDPALPIRYVDKGDSEFVSLELESPVKFYSENYDKIFINTNGILTFNIEFGDYINQPFPLEYASIAPFYSNVDTSGNNLSSTISIFESVAPEQLEKASNLVEYAFSEKIDFEATKLIVATWKNVGYFNGKSDKNNTFQVVLITNEEETYVQFTYPLGGINWLQGETGSLGLPDVRAQAGFVSEDGRFYNLEGSGSDNVRFLSENSNVGVDGVWIYRVGPLGLAENVQPPTNIDTLTEPPEDIQSCAEGSYRHCHSNANCFDKSNGFCCVCREGFYGNGLACIKNDYPIRLLGTLLGKINGQDIDELQLQSYVVMSDGRSYTAINPVSSELGAKLRMLLPVVNTVGWLFAKPMRNGTLNGYQLTGGKLYHVSKLNFDTGERLTIRQMYEGLNYWDQLTMKIEVSGDVPEITATAKFHMGDFIEEYKFTAPDELQSVHSHTLEIPEKSQVVNFELSQTVSFDRCMLDGEVDPTGTSVLHKVAKVVLDYFEQDRAIRTSVLTKIGVDQESNACTDGSAICGENMICVPYEDTYRCDCLHGFGPQLDEDGEEACVDIDECALGTHVCDENALCTNNDGGFTCVCFDGFEGNGYRCLQNSTAADNIESTTLYYELGRSNQVEECNRCSHEADCLEGRCRCRPGFAGDGYTCRNLCGHDEAWEHDKCVPLLLDDHDIEPECDIIGECTCPDGYELTSNEQMCRYVGHYEPDSETALDDLVPCDVDANCHMNATCVWHERQLRHVCSCNPGFHGDGYSCFEIENESCALNPDICGANSVCRYDDALGMSKCFCERGYELVDHRCELSPDCNEDADCGLNAFCYSGICNCNAGFERDNLDLCVPQGRCGPVTCGANAVCKWDASQGVQYCDCIDGYEGDALQGCTSIPVPCNVKYNCGVHATCEPTDDPARYECQCMAGFHGDGNTCIEERNCLNDPNMCDMNAKCLSTNTGLVCVCNPGFYGNGSLCQERQQHESGFLLVSQGVVIVRVPFNGKNVRPISVASMAIGLDKDCVEGRIYWGDISAKKIISAKYDGTESRPFITEDIESPEGIAIDSISRRIYWTDSVKDTIEVASLDDPTLRAVLINKNLVNPRGIAVDSYREKLYWSDWNRESPKIEMSDLDGTAREILLGKDSVTLPNSLVVLDDSGELCFADAGTKKVECIDAYSKQIRTISNELTYPFGLAYSQNRFFWTDWTTKKIESVDTLGVRQNALQTPFFGSHKMYGMTSIEEKCPQMGSPCQINNGGCTDSRICLVNRKAPSGKSCKCTILSQSCNIPQHGVPF